MDSRTMARRETAFHEAGHAAVALVLGYPPARASILATEDHEGVVEHSFHPDLDAMLETLSNDVFEFDSEQRTPLESTVQVLAAGRLAAERAGFEGVGSEGDSEKAWLLLERASRGEEEAEAYLHWLEARASTELRLVWAGVEALAGALLERGELDGKALRETFYVAFRPRPEV